MSWPADVVFRVRLIVCCANGAARTHHHNHRPIARSFRRAASNIRYARRIQFPCTNHPKCVNSLFDFRGLALHAAAPNSRMPCFSMAKKKISPEQKIDALTAQYPTRVLSNQQFLLAFLSVDGTLAHVAGPSRCLCSRCTCRAVSPLRMRGIGERHVSLWSCWPERGSRAWTNRQLSNASRLRT